jgi:ATPase subunit of ABC transporter with duplicated ATPase domains
MPSLVCSTLSFSWPSGEEVFTDLTVSFPAGRTGLVGRNGVGKSTLLRILAGELAPTSGSVSAPGTVGYLPQQLVLQSDRTVAGVLGIEPVVAALQRIDAGQGTPADFETVGDAWDIEERSAAALGDFGLTGLDPQRQIGTLSGGQVILLALASLFLAAPDVLILDEPTNNLDRDARALLYQAVSRWRGPVLMVSHDRELLDLVDQIGEMRDSSVRFFGGNFTDYTAALEVEQEAAARGLRAAQGDLQRQQRELAEARIKLDRRQRFARSQAGNVPKIVAGAKKRAAEVSAGKLRGGHQADVAEARQQLELAEERVRDDDLIRVDLTSTRVPRSRDVVVTDDLVLRNGLPVSLHVRGPERIGLTGANGSGKTTLIDTLTGAVAPRSGSVSVRVPFRLLPQRLQLLRDDDTVLAAVSRHAPTADANTLRAQLARFLLSAATVTRPVRTLSGGERFRATLAALLLAEPAPQLLILDEPTNNLDLDSVRQLTAALAEFEGALLVSSHDQQLLQDLSLDRRLDLNEIGADAGNG